MTSQNAKRAVHIPRDPQAPINILCALKPQVQPADAVHQFLERYAAIVRRSMPEFQVAEWCLIFDALKPGWIADEGHTAQLATEIREAIQYEKLDGKWNVDGARLRGRIDKLSFAARTAIGEMTEWFWQSDPDTEYAEIIRSNLDVIKLPARPPVPVRSDRLSPDRMGGDTAPRPAAPVSQDDPPGDPPPDDPETPAGTAMEQADPDGTEDAAAGAGPAETADAPPEQQEEGQNGESASNPEETEQQPTGSLYDQHAAQDPGPPHLGRRGLRR